MNILFLANFPIESTSGGVQRVTSILGKGLEEVGFNVNYLSLFKKNPLKDSCKKQLYVTQTSSFSKIAKEIINIIDSKNIDVIINQAGIYKSTTKILKIVKKDCNRVKIITVHHNCISCLNLHYRDIVLGNINSSSHILKKVDYEIVWIFLRYFNRVKYSNLFKKSIKLSDKFILLADEFKNELCDLGVVRNDKIFAIPNPASFDAFPKALAVKQNRIVFIGRLNFTQKRVDKLMEVYHKLHNKYLDWQFDIVGDGIDRDWMEEYKRLNKLDRIHFHGYSDPRQYLEKAKIFTLTSDFEGFGMVIPEAQAYGVVPVVTPCFSAIHEVVGDGAGIVLKDNNADTMVEAVIKLIDSPNQMESIAKLALLNVEKFNARKIVSTWVDLLNKLKCEK